MFGERIHASDNNYGLDLPLQVNFSQIDTN